MASPKMLLVMDFDQTIIDDNIDVWIRKLFATGRVPEEIKNRYKKHDSWTQYMADIFSDFYKSGIQKTEILECIRDVPFTAGMIELLKYQQTLPSVDTIIASDANSLFISHILEGVGLGDAYKEIFSNPAEFDASGCLTIKPYHKHDCKRCPANLCKGTVLKDFLKKQSQVDGIDYDRVAVIGDGSNDFCPCLGLRESDVIFPRKGYRLLKKIEQYAADQANKLQACVIPWDSAHEILQCLQQIINPEKDRAFVDP